MPVPEWVGSGATGLLLSGPQQVVALCPCGQTHLPSFWVGFPGERSLLHYPEARTLQTAMFMTSALLILFY